MHLAFFEQLLIMLTASVALLTLFYRLKIPALLAFLIVGVTCGPKGTALVTHVEDINALAELGLVFLLFMLGLEFSLPRMIAMRQIVLKIGGSQVAVCTGAFMAVFWWLGLPWQASLILAGGLALSSTAIVSKELLQIAQLHTRHGQIAIGTLLFQDIVAVALLISVPLLAASDAFQPSMGLIASALGKGALLLGVLWVAGRFVLPNLLAETARARSDELLVMTALVIALLAGWFTHWLGLSMELGAFLAGMALGESHYRHQLEADTRPFRDLLLGLFFISIGMLIDVQHLQQNWPTILLLGLALIAFKASIIALVAKLLGETWKAAIPAAIALAQGGEFLFALLALATREQLVSADVASYVLSVTIVTMAATPLLIRFAQAITRWIVRSSEDTRLAESDLPTLADNAHDNRHVIICGFGRVGQIVARFLHQAKIPYIALETDSVRINEASAAGEPIFYGDPTRRDILKTAGIQDALLVVVSFDDYQAATTITQHAREWRSDIPVLIRTRDDRHLDQLIAAGATEVVPETLEASLTLVSHVLLLLKVPADEVQRLTDAVRHDRYSLLHGFYHGERLGLVNRHGMEPEIVHAIPLPAGAKAIGLALADLALEETGVELQSIRRTNGQNIDEPARDFILHPDDVMVVKGSPDAIEKAEAALLGG
ncbi:MAG TPA: cation:proton antiporter [Pseudomonadales bacterium]